MENDASRYLNSRITALGVYQVMGGLIGIYYLIVFVTGSHNIPSVTVAIVTLGFLVHCFSIFCGVFLFKDRMRGARFSITNQLLQVISFFAMGFGYDYVSGISAKVDVSFSPEVATGMESSLSNWVISFKGDTSLSMVSFNIVAIFLVIFTIRLQRRIHIQALEEEAQFDEEPAEPAQ